MAWLLVLVVIAFRLIDWLIIITATVILFPRRKVAFLLWDLIWVILVLVVVIESALCRVDIPSWVVSPLLLSTPVLLTVLGLVVAVIVGSLVAVLLFRLVALNRPLTVGVVVLVWAVILREVNSVGVSVEIDLVVVPVSLATALVV